MSKKDISKKEEKKEEDDEREVKKWIFYYLSHGKAISEYSPELNKICEELEVKLISEYFPYFKDEYLDFYNNVDPIVNLLVKLADVVDVIMFINREETLGNRDEDILQIRAECNERFIKIKLDLIEALEKEKGNK